MRQLLSDWRLFLALGGGAGLSPVAPGTAGTLIALPLFYAAAALLPPPALLPLAITLLIIGAPLCAYAEQTLQTKDDRRIVWDELSVFFAILAALPHDDWRRQLAAFALFRLLDALKPFPINIIDRRVKGGIGIMADDIAAGAITIIVMIGAGDIVGAALKHLP